MHKPPISDCFLKFFPKATFSKKSAFYLTKVTLGCDVPYPRRGRKIRMPSCHLSGRMLAGLQTEIKGYLVKMVTEYCYFLVLNYCGK